MIEPRNKYIKNAGTAIIPKQRDKPPSLKFQSYHENMRVQAWQNKRQYEAVYTGLL
jgi:predicted transcriptional regulator